MHSSLGPCLLTWAGSAGSRTWCLAVFCGAALPGGVLSFSNITKHLLAFAKAMGPVLAGFVAAHLPPLYARARYLQHGPTAELLTPSCSCLHLQLVSGSSPAAWLLTSASSCSLQPVCVPCSLHTRSSVQGCRRAGLCSLRPHGEHHGGAGGEHRHGGVGRDGELGMQGGLNFVPLCVKHRTRVKDLLVVWSLWCQQSGGAHVHQELHAQEMLLHVPVSV